MLGEIMEKSGRLFHPTNMSTKAKPSGGRTSRTQLVQPRYTGFDEVLDGIFCSMYALETLALQATPVLRLFFRGGLDPGFAAAKFLSGRERGSKPPSKRAKLHCIPTIRWRLIPRSSMCGVRCCCRMASWTYQRTVYSLSGYFSFRSLLLCAERCGIIATDSTHDAPYTTITILHKLKRRFQRTRHALLQMVMAIANFHPKDDGVYHPLRAYLLDPISSTRRPADCLVQQRAHIFTC